MNLFDVVGELAELRQADHPAAALQRVELPAHRAQRVTVAWIAGSSRAIRRDRVEHFRGFDQVDLEQLGVESLRVGREQALRLPEIAGAGVAPSAAFRDRVDRRQGDGAAAHRAGFQRSRACATSPLSPINSA